MEVFRISSEKYSGALTASGVSNRWNKDNQFAIYTGESRSLSTLENIVHLNVMPVINFEVMVISIADDENLFKRILINDLPSDWRSDAQYPKLQDIGSEWYTNQESLILQVPSATIPQEFNYIINIMHSDFSKKVSLVKNEQYFWDKRLFPVR